MENLLLKSIQKPKVSSEFGIFQFLSGFGSTVHAIMAILLFALQSYKNQISCSKVSDPRFDADFVESSCVNSGLKSETTDENINYHA